MRLTLGPLQYFWPRRQVLDFYAESLDWPLDVVYLGETVCSKRRELNLRDWVGLAEQQTKAGREVVLSSLALIEAESELGALRRLAGLGNVRIEANDISAVQVCRRHGVPFVGGPSLNVYNLETLRLLQDDGLYRLVLNVEMGCELVAELRQAAAAAGCDLPELELIAWGRLPLSYSARCFTARALDLAKDQCGFRCIEYPDGLPLSTREGRHFLTINGVQMQGAENCDLLPEWTELAAAGIGLLRLYPQQHGTAQAVRRFDAVRGGAAVPPREPGCTAGYWSGLPGMQPPP
ncbi:MULTISPECIES: U32 family peptidase [Tahibacter]|uniref:Ubiquinone biosynthesis protein UbiV n=1 Tax=Tahibacter aquaticus TaxID=520092 RepID=A0A4R6YME1_9GAMM|nr:MULTISPECIES: U32 family peptidase [Tahibacter]TDR38571.1 collagenase-like PrtC family protease [Tahibacter aquaticus]